MVRMDTPGADEHQTDDDMFKDTMIIVVYCLVIMFGVMALNEFMLYNRILMSFEYY